jgi:pimeloyl-ACP methyl ester carboxylesterase
MKKILLLCALILTSCLSMKVNKKNIVLIHGSHFDKNVWGDVEASLSNGHHVLAITLPGRGDNEQFTLFQIAQKTCSQLPRYAVVIGHSFAGAVINQMIGICPEKFSKIIYLSAVVPLSGEKPFDLLGKTDEQNYMKAVNFGSARITPSKDKPTFLKLMDKEAKDSRFIKIYSEAYLAGSEKLAFDESVFKNISKSYIVTKDDEIITQESQKKYLDRTAFEKVVTIPGGHLPMVARPSELTKKIEELL